MFYQFDSISITHEKKQFHDVNDIFLFKKIIFKLLTLIFINYSKYFDTTNNVTLSTRVLMLKFNFFNVIN